MSALDKLQQDWDDLAEVDPMWAILSDPTKQQRQWEAEEFFETGKRQIRDVLDMLGSLDVVLNAGTALDFGCGIGRLTQALAGDFQRVYGVDISPEMIKQAHRFNRHGDRCRYILNAQGDLRIFDDESFDFIYTYVVLQHMPTDLMLGYLREFIRILKSGGILVFQVPVERLEHDLGTSYLRSLPRYHPRRVANRLKGLLIGHGVTDRYYRLRKLGVPKAWLYAVGFRPDIQMHTLDEALVTQFVSAHGGEIVRRAKSSDESSTMLWEEFVVVKHI